MRSQIFISYSHKDKKWLEDIQTMLKPLIRAQKISVWDDKKIEAGQKWREEIGAALSMAKVAVLLVSPDFLASDFIAYHELPKLLDSAKQEGLTILWVAVRYCLYKDTEIEQYQATNDPQKPLASLRPAERERILVEICERIKLAAIASSSESRHHQEFESWSPLQPASSKVNEIISSLAKPSVEDEGARPSTIHALESGNYLRVIEKIGPRDPETEGFKAYHDVSATVVYNQKKTGYEAWQVSTRHMGYYSHPLTKVQKEAAYRKGWRLSMAVQVVSGFAYANVDFVGVGKRFDINVKIDQNNELIVWLTTGIAPTWMGPEHRLADVGDLYHTYELVFDPASQAAALLVDGEKIESVQQFKEYRGLTEFQEDRGVFFGTALYQRDRGIANFKHVRFEVNP
jgi:hypothetical protein